MACSVIGGRSVVTFNLTFSIVLDYVAAYL